MGLVEVDKNHHKALIHGAAATLSLHGNGGNLAAAVPSLSSVFIRHAASCNQLQFTNPPYGRYKRVRASCTARLKKQHPDFYGWNTSQSAAYGFFQDLRCWSIRNRGRQSFTRLQESSVSKVSDQNLLVLAADTGGIKKAWQKLSLGRRSPSVLCGKCLTDAF